MKTKTYIKLLLALILCNVTINFSQAQNFPYGINYQAVARDANGNAQVNQSTPLRFTIYKTSATGTIVWRETQTATTNNMGQFNTIIGTGQPINPFTAISFSQINWGNDSYFLMVELQTGIATFVQIGTTNKFQSVPYALNANTTNDKQNLSYNAATGQLAIDNGAHTTGNNVSLLKPAPTVQRFLSGSGTYTTPANVAYIEVTIVGGGGGGSEARFYVAGGGGGAGGTLSFIIPSPSATYTYVVGVGGAVSTYGGNTIFDANTAAGGTAAYRTAGYGGTNYGGAGGVNTFSLGILMVNLQGGDGGSGSGPGSSASSCIGGSGGNSSLAGGGAGGSGADNGHSGLTNSGGGGGGGGHDQGPGADYNGGVGGSGIIIVKEFYK